MGSFLLEWYWKGFYSAKPHICYDIKITHKFNVQLYFYILWHCTDDQSLNMLWKYLFGLHQCHFKHLGNKYYNRFLLFLSTFFALLCNWGTLTYKLKGKYLTFNIHNPNNNGAWKLNCSNHYDIINTSADDHMASCSVLMLHYNGSIAVQLESNSWFHADAEFGASGWVWCKLGIR